MKNSRDELQEMVMGKLDMESKVEDGMILKAIDEILVEQKSTLYLPLRLRFQYRKELFDSLRRLDVLSEVSDDPEVTEIMVNGPDHIFVEKGGIWKLLREDFPVKKNWKILYSRWLLMQIEESMRRIP